MKPFALKTWRVLSFVGIKFWLLTCFVVGGFFEFFFDSNGSTSEIPTSEIEHNHEDGLSISLDNSMQSSFDD